MADAVDLQAQALAVHLFEKLWDEGVTLSESSVYEIRDDERWTISLWRKGTEVELDGDLAADETWPNGGPDSIRTELLPADRNRIGSTTTDSAEEAAELLIEEVDEYLGE